MKYALLLLNFWMLPVIVQAQIVPDTLDARRYYPLEVGNEWHYQSSDFLSGIPSYKRQRIVSDTLVNNIRYFQYVSEFFSPGFTPAGQREGYFRYNAAGAVEAVDDPSSDSTFANIRIPWYHADFGDTLRTNVWLEIVGGRYDSSSTIAGVAYSFAAIKTRSVPDPITGVNFYVTEAYAADIGRIYEIVFDGPYTGLVYAKIGGIEYGSPTIRVALDDTPSLPQRTRLVAAFPNPSRDTIFIMYETRSATPPTLTVFDLLGRQVHTQNVSSTGAGLHQERLNLSHLVSGRYMMQLQSEEGTSMQPLIITR